MLRQQVHEISVQTKGRGFYEVTEQIEQLVRDSGTALTCVSVSIPILSSRLALGTWQGLYLWEHRLAPHRRRLAVHILGE